MQLFKKLTTINFIGARKVALVFSIALIATCAYSLSTQGLNYGIDFSGGTKLELAYQEDVSVLDMRETLASNGYSEAVVQHFGSNRDVLVRIPLSTENSDDKVSDDVVKILAASEVGPGEVRSVSVIALIHDVIITIGLFSLLQLEFTLPVLAALLAVIGYSLNDTIVVFDRIRENFRKLRDTETEETMNVSINQTLPRTILTSLTTLLVLIALYFYGGDALNGFAATLIIGVLIGTYSSIFVASPSVLALGAKAEDLLVEVVEKEGADQPEQPYMP